DAAARHWFGVGAGSLDAGQAVRLAAVIINPRRFSPVEPEERILHRIQLIASRLRRRGAITEDEYRVALGLPPEAPAPAVDSTRFAPQALPGAVPEGTPPAASTAPPAGEPEPAPEPAPVDTSVAPR